MTLLPCGNGFDQRQRSGLISFAVAVMLKPAPIKAKASPLNRHERELRRGNLNAGQEPAPLTRRKTLASSRRTAAAPEATLTSNPAVSHTSTGKLEDTVGFERGLA